MKKIVFLGCENSHCNMFLNYIKEDAKYKDVEVLGCHSELDKQAEEKLANSFNIKRLANYDSEVGNADGVVVAARHGGYHLKFAKPYLKEGVTAYIDKPFTISEEDAIELVKTAKENKVKLTGQSSLILDKNIVELKKLREEKGCVGGFVRSIINMDNPHGGFYFYAEHLVDMVLFIFGWNPKSVLARVYKDHINVTFKYENYDVEGIFEEKNDQYCAGVCFAKGQDVREVDLGVSTCFKDHFDEFYEVMKNDNYETNYEQFLPPVFVMNAIDRSIKSGKEEKVREFKF